MSSPVEVEVLSHDFLNPGFGYYIRSRFADGSSTDADIDAATAKKIIHATVTRLDPMDSRLALAGAAMFTMMDELLGAGFLPEEVEDDARACLNEWTTAWKASS